MVLVVHACVFRISCVCFRHVGACLCPSSVSGGVFCVREVYAYMCVFSQNAPSITPPHPTSAAPAVAAAATGINGDDDLS